MRRKSITFRLTLFFATASSVVLAAIGVLIGSSIETHFEHEDVAEMTGKLELVRHALGKVHTQADIDAFRQHLDDALVGHSGLSVAVIAPDGRTIFATAGADFPTRLIESAGSGPDSMHSSPVVWSTGKHANRGIAEKAPAGMTGAKPYTVAIGLDINHHQEFMAEFHQTLWITFGAGILLAVLLGWVAARRGLAPVREIGEVSKRISANHLNDRLPVESVPAELTDLANSFNEMLARLEDSFRRLSDFSSDLAHELRTPVSNLMTQTQVALSHPRSADDYREVLYSNLEEFERLARMIGDMLFLAKADHGFVVPNREDIDLAKEVDALIEFYEALCEERGIIMSRDGKGFIVGDKLMIRRAISNLLSNAIAHTCKGGSVKIRIAEDKLQSVSIVVENPGETIAQEQLPRLFDRFYRVDPARAHTASGAGLGLAITKSIMEAHGGKILVSSDDGITRFKLILAAAPT